MRRPEQCIEIVAFHGLNGTTRSLLSEALRDQRRSDTGC
jgi:hypothetical protein